MLSTSCVLCVLVSLIHAGLLRDLISPSGYALGDGFVVHLLDSKLPNVSFFERQLLKMDYGGYGVSLAKAPQKDAVQVGFYAEGRGRKSSSSHLLHLIIGYKLATLASLALSIVGALVLKALGVAKIAFVVSAILLLTKLFQHKEHPSPVITEIEPPEMHWEPSQFFKAADMEPMGSEYYSYGNYASATDFGDTIAATSVGNVTGPQVVRRRDVTRGKKIPLVTIRQYTSKSV